MAIRRTVAGAGATRGAQPTGPTTTLGSRVSIIVSPRLVIFMALPLRFIPLLPPRSPDEVGELPPSSFPTPDCPDRSHSGLDRCVGARSRRGTAQARCHAPDRPHSCEGYVGADASGALR